MATARLKAAMEFNDCPPLPDEAILIVCSSWPSLDLATAAGEAAVAAGHAACCQTGPPVHSIYRWEGKVEQAQEVMLTGKTTVRAWPGFCAFLKSRHPYQVPEIMAWPVSHGLPAYMDWVRTHAASSPPAG
jgi:periplasmic divalent cation tolerance protein